jgi:hypothetical protein
MNAAGFDLRQVHEQRGEQLIRLSNQTPSIREQLIVREVSQATRPAWNELRNDVAGGVGFRFHVPTYTHDLSARGLRHGGLSATEMSFDSSNSR